MFRFLLLLGEFPQSLGAPDVGGKTFYLPTQKGRGYGTIIERPMQV
jgi:hypothetical protein